MKIFVQISAYEGLVELTLVQGGWSGFNGLRMILIWIFIITLVPWEKYKVTCLSSSLINVGITSEIVKNIIFIHGPRIEHIHHYIRIVIGHHGKNMASIMMTFINSEEKKEGKTNTYIKNDNAVAWIKSNRSMISKFFIEHKLKEQRELGLGHEITVHTRACMIRQQPMMRCWHTLCRIGHNLHHSVPQLFPSLRCHQLVMSIYIAQNMC